MKSKKIIIEWTVLAVLAVVLIYRYSVIIYQYHNAKIDQLAMDLDAQGKLLEQQGKYDEALPVIEKAIKLRPKMGKTHLLLGVVYARKKDFKKAEEEFLTSLGYDLSPVNRAIVHYNLGSIYLGEMELYDKAIVEFKLSLESDPNFFEAETDAHLGLANAYLANGEYDEAIKEAEASIKLNPKGENGYFTLAYLYLLKQDLIRAREVCAELQKMDDKRATELLALVESGQMLVILLPEIKSRGGKLSEETKKFFYQMLYYSARRDEKAMKELAEERLKNKPKDTLARFWLSLYYYGQRNLDEAKKVLQEGLTENKQDYALLMNLSLFNLVSEKSLNKEPELQDAQAYFAQDIFKDVNETNIELAEKYLLKAYSYYPEFPYPLPYLAKISEHKNDSQKALEYWQKNYTLNPNDLASALCYGQLLAKIQPASELTVKILEEVLKKDEYNFYQGYACNELAKYYAGQNEAAKASAYEKMYNFYKWLIPCATIKYNPKYEAIAEKLSSLEKTAQLAPEKLNQLKSEISGLSAISDLYATEFLASLLWKIHDNRLGEIEQLVFQALEKKGKDAISYYVFLLYTNEYLKDKITASLINLENSLQGEWQQGPK
jgi:tetratricopeptide (TPR) repeat protein